VQVALGIAGMKHESLGRVLQLCLNELASEPHHLGRLIDQGTGLCIDRTGAGAADLEACLLQHAKASLKNPFDLLARQDLERRPRVPEARNRRERRAGRPRRA
jgi:hypothetical protein